MGSGASGGGAKYAVEDESESPDSSPRPVKRGSFNGGSNSQGARRSRKAEDIDRAQKWSREEVESLTIPQLAKWLEALGTDMSGICNRDFALAKLWEEIQAQQPPALAAIQEPSHLQHWPLPEMLRWLEHLGGFDEAVCDKDTLVQLVLDHGEELPPPTFLGESAEDAFVTQVARHVATVKHAATTLLAQLSAETHQAQAIERLKHPWTPNGKVVTAFEGTAFDAGSKAGGGSNFLDVVVGDRVDVTFHEASGWAWCMLDSGGQRQGWVPCTSVIEVANAVEDHTDTSAEDGTLPLKRGQILQVVLRHYSGWTLVRVHAEDEDGKEATEQSGGDGAEGWVPDAYLTDHPRNHATKQQHLVLTGLFRLAQEAAGIEQSFLRLRTHTGEDGDEKLDRRGLIETLYVQVLSLVQEYRNIYGLAASLVEQAIASQAERAALADKAGGGQDEEDADQAQEQTLKELPRWVFLGASCLWKSKSHGRILPVTIKKICAERKQVMVVFDSDGKSRKVVDFDAFKDSGTCPLQPSESALAEEKKRRKAARAERRGKKSALQADVQQQDELQQGLRDMIGELGAVPPEVEGLSDGKSSLSDSSDSVEQLTARRRNRSAVKGPSTPRQDAAPVGRRPGQVVGPATPRLGDGPAAAPEETGDAPTPAKPADGASAETADLATSAEAAAGAAGDEVTAAKPSDAVADGEFPAGEVEHAVDTGGDSPTSAAAAADAGGEPFEGVAEAEGPAEAARAEEVVGVEATGVKEASEAPSAAAAEAAGAGAAQKASDGAAAGEDAATAEEGRPAEEAPVEAANAAVEASHGATAEDAPAEDAVAGAEAAACADSVDGAGPTMADAAADGGEEAQAGGAEAEADEEAPEKGAADEAAAGAGGEASPAPEAVADATGEAGGADADAEGGEEAPAGDEAPAAAADEGTRLLIRDGDVEHPAGEEAPAGTGNEKQEAAAAVRIQSVYRGRIGRQKASSARHEVEEEARRTLQEASATRIQSAYRGQIARRRAAAAKKTRQEELGRAKEAEAAVVLQAGWRGFQDRKRCASLREENAANLQRSKEDGAAVVLQAAWRGTQGRKRCVVLREERTVELQRAREDGAAARIQAGWRGRQDRKDLVAKRAERNKQNEAALKIQGLLHMKRAREQVEALRFARQNAAAEGAVCRIQRAARVCLARRRVDVVRAARLEARVEKLVAAEGVDIAVHGNPRQHDTQWLEDALRLVEANEAMQKKVSKRRQIVTRHRKAERLAADSSQMKGTSKSGLSASARSPLPAGLAQAARLDRWQLAWRCAQERSGARVRAMLELQVVGDLSPLETSAARALIVDEGLLARLAIDNASAEAAQISRVAWLLAAMCRAGNADGGGLPSGAPPPLDMAQSSVKGLLRRVHMELATSQDVSRAGRSQSSAAESSARKELEGKVAPAQKEAEELALAARQVVKEPLEAALLASRQQAEEVLGQLEGLLQKIPAEKEALLKRRAKEADEVEKDLRDKREEKYAQTVALHKLALGTQIEKERLEGTLYSGNAKVSVITRVLVKVKELQEQLQELEVNGVNNRKSQGILAHTLRALEARATKAEQANRRPTQGDEKKEEKDDYVPSDSIKKKMDRQAEQEVQFREALESEVANLRADLKAKAEQEALAQGAAMRAEAEAHQEALDSAVEAVACARLEADNQRQWLGLIVPLAKSNACVAVIAAHLKSHDHSAPPAQLKAVAARLEATVGLLGKVRHAESPRESGFRELAGRLEKAKSGLEHCRKDNPDPEKQKKRKGKRAQGAAACAEGAAEGLGLPPPPPPIATEGARAAPQREGVGTSTKRPVSAASVRPPTAQPPVAVGSAGPAGTGGVGVAALSQGLADLGGELTALESALGGARAAGGPAFGGTLPGPPSRKPPSQRPASAAGNRAALAAGRRMPDAGNKAGNGNVDGAVSRGNSSADMLFEKSHKPTPKPFVASPSGKTGRPPSTGSIAGRKAPSKNGASH